jgi:hypothetical protein
MRCSSRSLLVAGLTALGVPLRAQTTLETSKARIELIGLHRWTLRMIQDSLAVYAPGDSLTGHACAAILRGKLHFADASVNVFVGFDAKDARNYVEIAVIEPQDSARIHYKEFKYDSLPVRAEWASAWASFKAQPELAQRAVQSASFRAVTLSAADSEKFAKVAPLHDVLARHRHAEDFAMARHTLDTDPAFANRLIAALIVGNFADKDEAWWALADAQRDPVGIVSGMASATLGMMTKTPRAVNWEPIATQLSYIVGGTNLFAFTRTIDVLTATNVSPSLATRLLSNGDTMVRAKLGSNAPGSREGAARFLAQLSGMPATSTSLDFARWLDGVARE